MLAKLAVLVAALCFGTLGAAHDIADLDAPPVSVGLARILLGGALLTLLVIGTPRGRRRSPGDRNPLSRVPTWLVVVFGAAAVLAYQPLFFLGTESNGVAVGAVVAIGSAPVLTGLFDAALRRRMPEQRWMIATALAIIGVVLVSGVVGSGVNLGGPGVLWSVAAGACYALYTVAAKELLDRGWVPSRAMGAMFGGAAAAALPLLVFVGADWLFTLRGILLLVWLGAVATALGYVLFGWGLARLPATTVTTLTLAEPLCAALLGIGLLGERVGGTGAVGLVVLALGLALLTVTPRRSRVPTTA